MGASRIDIFKQMLESDPANTSILFGLAKEYEKIGNTEEMIEILNRYLTAADDQGNALVCSPALTRQPDGATKRAVLTNVVSKSPRVTGIPAWPKNIAKH